MARIIAPDNPLEQYEIGCVRVFYPSHPLFFAGLMGQISALARRWMWDTGGDVAAAELIEQHWRTANELTWDTAYNGCPSVDCEECQQTIIDLNLQIDILNETILEYENMEITVNCNCGCCDGNNLAPPYTLPDGTEAPPTAVLIDPSDPLGETSPIWDLGNEIAPDGWTDYQTFFDARCRIANYITDQLIEIFEAIHLAGERLTTLTDGEQLLRAFLPPSIAGNIGFFSLVTWVQRYLQLLSFFGEILDYAGWISAAITSQRENIVCAIYNATDSAAAKTAVSSAIDSGLSSVPEFAGLTQARKDEVSDYVATVLSATVKLAASYAASQAIPAAYVAATDCAVVCADTVVIVELDSAGQSQGTVNIAPGQTVTITSYAQDAYAPWNHFAFNDGAAQWYTAQHNQFEIVGSSGYALSEVPQHPFTVQTKNSAGGDVQVVVPYLTALSIPYKIPYAGAGSGYSRVDVSSAPGTLGFTLQIKRNF